MKEQNATEINDILNNKENNLIILDVREKWEFDLCSIPESIHMPIAEVILRISELEKTNPIIIICHTGRRSLHIGLELIEKGFDNVINLKGGVDQWADDIDTSMTKYGMKEILENS